SGQARRRQRLALLEPSANDRVERRRSHFDRAARQRLAPRHRFFADVDHPHAPAAVEMRERAARGVAGKFAGEFGDRLLAWHRGRRLRAYVGAMRRYNKALQYTARYAR